ncbi:hypothetical protein KPL37_16250 [Clostridium frigoris]|uniref:Fibronectin type-III domain-containing protein n=1 Tax=Clostridium frigoris TaxID=205327 RepID=A0ABS6BXD4_9CLOT|nr:hypothetical protein [Clostridium frigoris]MBU3161266.1 hypothetical protein [Clostridium frigoris]
MTIKKFMLIPTAVLLLGLVQAPSTFATTSNGVQQSVVQANATLLTVTGAKTVSASTSSTTTTWSSLAGITNYDVYQATSLNGNYSYISKLGNVSSFTLKGLTKGHTYYYKVRANKIINGKNIYSNTDTFSATSSATVGQTTIVTPPVTVGTTATVKSAGFGAVINVTSTQTGAAKYQVIDGTSFLSAIVNLGTDTTIFPAKVKGDTVTIKLFDASGTLINTSNVVIGQSGTIPVVSGLLTVDGTKTVATSPTSTTTSWSLLSGVDGYDIYQATSLNGSYTFIARRANTVSSFELKGLDANKTYYYKVRAYKFVNGVNEYSNTNTFSAITSSTVGTTPVDPVLLTVGGTSTVATSSTSSTTSWNLLEGVDGYDIYQATSLNGAYSFIARRANTVSSFDLKGLDANKTYFYKVRANKFVNGVNKYSNTNTFSAITSSTVGAVPVQTDAKVVTTIKKAANFGAVANVTLTADGVKAYPLATQYQIVTGTSKLSAVSLLGTATVVFPAKVAGDIVSIKLFDASNNLLTTIESTLGQ